MKKTHGMLKRLIATGVSLSLIFGSAVNVFALDTTARVINVFKVEGQNVHIARGIREAAARAGQRLNEGNVITTGVESNVLLQMDETSILLMDEQSQVAVGSTRNRLSLTVQSGHALVDAGTQLDGQTLEVRVGNRGLTVRGTMFTIGQDQTGVITIVMLSGAGEIDGIWLDAGDMLVILNHAEVGYLYEITRGFTIPQLNYFTLRAIVNNVDYLVNDAGSFTLEMIDEAHTTLYGSGGRVRDEAGYIVAEMPDAPPQPNLPALPDEPSAPEAETPAPENGNDQDQGQGQGDGNLVDMPEGLPEDDDTGATSPEGGDDPADGTDPDTDVSTDDDGTDPDTDVSTDDDGTDPDTDINTDDDDTDPDTDISTDDDGTDPDTDVSTDDDDTDPDTDINTDDDGTDPDTDINTDDDDTDPDTDPDDDLDLFDPWEGFVEIFSAEQLATVLAADPSANVRLMNDIQVTLGMPGFPLPNFTGTLEGGAHTISMEMSNIANPNGAGLFSQIGNGGQVSNLNLTGNVQGNGVITGALAGSNAGTISGVTSSVTVQGSGTIAGGLVGTNTGNVTNSYTTGTVTRSGAGGGMAGTIVGQNNGGNVSNNFSTGHAEAQTPGGMVVGSITGNAGGYNPENNLSGNPGDLDGALNDLGSGWHIVGGQLRPIQTPPAGGFEADLDLGFYFDLPEDFFIADQPEEIYKKEEDEEELLEGAPESETAPETKETPDTEETLETEADTPNLETPAPELEDIDTDDAFTLPSPDDSYPHYKEEEDEPEVETADDSDPEDDLETEAEAGTEPSEDEAYANDEKTLTPEEYLASQLWNL